MKNVKKIFARDFNAMIHNPVAILIVLGVIVLPSLYAWINIIASWDPYTNTSSIPIVVVSEDKGATIKGEYINIGDDVVEELKNNDKIEWNFEESAQVADKDLRNGKYYASIIITENFSNDLISVLDEQQTKPEIIYKSDTKENPVIAKITNAVKDTLVSNIKQNFIKAVNKAIFEKLTVINEKAVDNERVLLELKTTLEVVDSNMDFVISMLDSSTSSFVNFENYLAAIQNTLPMLRNSLINMQYDNKNSRRQVRENEKTLDGVFDSINRSANTIQENNRKKNQLTADLASTINTASKAYQIEQAEALEALYAESITATEGMITYYEGMLVVAPTEQDKQDIQRKLDELYKLETDLKNQQDNVEEISESIANSGDLAEQQIAELNSIEDDTLTEIVSSVAQTNNSISIGIKNINDDYVAMSHAMDGLLENRIEMVDTFNESLSVAVKDNNLNAGLSESLYEDIVEFDNEISAMSNALEDVDYDTIKTLVYILQTSPEELSDYISNPFEITNESIYTIKNYGSAMTPMYSALAMWVGAVILTSVFTTSTKKSSTSLRLKSTMVREEYVGKLLWFCSLACLQGLVLMVGNKLLIGVQTSNTFWFVVLGVYCSLIFSIIVYTNVSLFGGFGKAINVVMMVLQIAGSGGAYPIQLEPMVFRILQPFFPFSYVLSILRETIAGVLPSVLIYDVIVLTFIGAVFIAVGLTFKERINYGIEGFNEKFEETHLAE